MELENQICDNIIILSEQGDTLAENDKFDEAIKKYREAMSLLPEPKKQWEASTWLYAAIGDAYYFLDNYKISYNNFMDALNCPDSQDNSFIYLRIGQNLFHLEKGAEAIDSLLKAYMLGGEEIFEDEEKYFEFLKSKVNL